MATFSIEIADADAQTVTEALAFNAGYNADTDGDVATFAVNSVINYINAIVHAVAVNKIRLEAEAAISTAVDAIPAVAITPVAPVVDAPVAPAPGV